MIPFRPRGSMEVRREVIDRIADMSVKATIVGSRILVVGLGEASYEITFPVYFTEIPIISFGAAMDLNQAPVAGNLPEAAVTVLRWNKVQEVIGGFDGYYTGGLVGIKARGGDPLQRMWVSYTALGRALTNPVNQISGLDVVL